MISTGAVNNQEEKKDEDGEKEGGDSTSSEEGAIAAEGAPAERGIELPP